MQQSGLAEYYYYPGWHEPGTVLEAVVNEKAFAELPDDLKAIVEHACHAANLEMFADFTAKNNEALKVLVDEHKVKLRRLPDDVLAKLQELSEEVVLEGIGDDPLAKRALESYQNFKTNVRDWHKISEMAYFDIVK